MQQIIRLYYALIDYILPPNCLSCAEMINTKDGFCANCWYKLDFITKPYCYLCGSKLDIAILDNLCCAQCFSDEPNYNMSRSLLKFNEYSKKIIHAFKYQDKTRLAKTFAKLLCVQYGTEIQKIDLIVPVPMNRFKRLFRMYNPALILTQEIAKILKKPWQADILIKLKWTKSQTFLSKIARKKNLANSLGFNKRYKITKQRILLVDDVLTTGTTVNQCTKLLQNAGASSVYTVTIAMT